MRVSLAASLLLGLAACSVPLDLPSAPGGAAAQDADHDGFTPSGGDCDDTRADVHPGARDVCGDGVDQNCDGHDADCRLTDFDSDGYAVQDSAGKPLDCDDSNPLVHPFAPEKCGDGIDQDCDGTDLACDLADQDGDGYAVTASAGGFPGGDCNDLDRRVHPNAPEICENGVDEDCAPEPANWAVPGPVHDRLCPLHADQDGDGYAPEAGGPFPGGDCDDHNPAVFPGAAESCNFVDDDCNGVIDDLGASCDHHDHQGADYAPRAGDGFTSTLPDGRLALSGIHFRIGRFSIAAGSTVAVSPVDSQGNGGSVEVRAKSIDISGRLDASGAGFGGGGGGGGFAQQVALCNEGGRGGLGARGGANGFDGRAGAPGDGGRGGGSFGGVGGSGADGKVAGYRATGANGDQTTSREVFVGSGGGGGAGGANWTGSGAPCGLLSSATYGGGAGGAGGGRVVLEADESLQIAAGGALVADGLSGTRGCAVEGLDADASAPGCTNSGRAGGGGSGGGVLLSCTASGGLAVNGTVSASGASGAAGGTVKVFCPGCAGHGPASISAGRRCAGEPTASCQPY